jgi:hypothetical protein
MRRTIAWLFLLAGTLSASARDSVDHWFEVRTQHFVVLTDANEKQGVSVAAQFERMRAVFHLLLPAASDSPATPIIVLALKDRKAFQALEPEAYLAKGQLDLAGVFMSAPDKNYILVRLDAQGEHPFATVYHEYTHFMMRNAGEWMPLWLNEGPSRVLSEHRHSGKGSDAGAAEPGRHPVSPAESPATADYAV